MLLPVFNWNGENKTILGVFSHQWVWNYSPCYMKLKSPQKIVKSLPKNKNYVAYVIYIWIYMFWWFQSRTFNSFCYIYTTITVYFSGGFLKALTVKKHVCVACECMVIYCCLKEMIYFWASIMKWVIKLWAWIAEAVDKDISGTLTCSILIPSVRHKQASNKCQIQRRFVYFQCIPIPQGGYIYNQLLDLFVRKRTRFVCWNWFILKAFFCLLILVPSPTPPPPPPFLPTPL